MLQTQAQIARHPLRNLPWCAPVPVERQTVFEKISAANTLATSELITLIRARVVSIWPMQKERFTASKSGNVSTSTAIVPPLQYPWISVEPPEVCQCDYVMCVLRIVLLDCTCPQIQRSFFHCFAALHSTDHSQPRLHFAGQILGESKCTNANCVFPRLISSPCHYADWTRNIFSVSVSSERFIFVLSCTLGLLQLFDPGLVVGAAARLWPDKEIRWKCLRHHEAVKQFKRNKKIAKVCPLSRFHLIKNEQRCKRYSWKKWKWHMMRNNEKWKWE